MQVELHSYPGTFHGSSLVTTQRCRAGPTRSCSSRSAEGCVDVDVTDSADAGGHQLQPLVLPQLGQAWQEPARCIWTPHCMQ